MPEPTRPLLLLPQLRQGPRTKGRGFAPRLQVPSVAHQAQRLAPKLTALKREIERQRARLQATVLGAYPEDVLVFEVIGAVERFKGAVERAEGLGWLAEHLGEDVAPDDDFYLENDREKPLATRLYFVAATRGGVDELLSLWNRHQRGEAFPKGHGAWRELFAHLNDVRRWGRRDRLEETGVLEAWEAEVEGGATEVQAEIELWYRPSTARRRQAEAAVVAALRDLGGEVLDGPAVVEEANLHLLLARLPARAVAELRTQEGVALAECAEVQGVRVPAQALTGEPGAVVEGEVSAAPRPDGEPVVAVLDGVILANHPEIEGRVVVDDPEGWALEVPVRDRHHGTAVVSVAIWGDLNARDLPPRRPIYVRPILRPVPGGGRLEGTPPDRLAVDVIHAAVVRMLDGEDPAAPDVAVINLSIGDKSRPFDGLALSPLARLLDALAWRYQVLFVVSAGNADPGPLQVQGAQDVLEADPKRRAEACGQALRDDWRHQRVLSPAEAINGLTVGALDDDAGPPLRGNVCQPFEGMLAPALYSRLGPGYRGSIKPDLMAAGGRGPVSILHQRPGTSAVSAKSPGRRGAFGIRVAAPPQVGEANPVSHVQGTSFAAPGVTHAAARISDALDAWIDREGVDLFQQAPRSVWIKALLLHGCERSRFHEFIGPLVQGADTSAKTRDERRLLDALVGYGAIDPSQVMACAGHRVTVMAGGYLEEDQAHAYTFPLPESLLQVGRTFRRSLRVTLAWLSPPWASSSRYRGAALSLDSVQAPKGLKLGTPETDHHAVGRGTALHKVWRTYRGVAAFQAGDELAVQVNCRSDALPRLDEPIPYALVLTFEVEEGLGVDIWQDVKTRIAPRVPVRARG